MTQEGWNAVDSVPKSFGATLAVLCKDHLFSTSAKISLLFTTARVILKHPVMISRLDYSSLPSPKSRVLQDEV